MTRPRISLATLALTACALTAGVACSDSGNSTSAGNSTQAGGSTPANDSTIAPNVATTPVAAQNPAVPASLQFAAPLVGGGTIDFTQYAGQTLALWFWAPT